MTRILKTKTKILYTLFYLVFFTKAEPSIVHAAEKDQGNSTYLVSSVKKDEVSYTIGRRNVLQIKIFGDAGTHQIYRVDELGYINHALIGKIKLADLTVTDAEKLIEEKLSGDYVLNPRVNIFVLQYSTFSIMGEVRKPGNYEITGRVSIIEALSMAGGFTAVANQRSVKIMRKKEGQETSINVDTTRITQQGDRSGDIDIQEDDVVVVPKSFF